jgi:hypothetical protein
MDLTFPNTGAMQEKRREKQKLGKQINQVILAKQSKITQKGNIHRQESKRVKEVLENTHIVINM